MTEKLQQIMYSRETPAWGRVTPSINHASEEATRRADCMRTEKLPQITAGHDRVAPSMGVTRLHRRGESMPQEGQEVFSTADPLLSSIEDYRKDCMQHVTMSHYRWASHDCIVEENGCRKKDRRCSQPQTPWFPAIEYW